MGSPSRKSDFLTQRGEHEEKKKCDTSKFETGGKHAINTRARSLGLPKKKTTLRDETLHDISFEAIQPVMKGVPKQQSETA